MCMYFVTKKYYICNMIGIYKITSPTGRVYIGQSINIESRFVSYKRSECSKQPRLRRSFAKHGVESHIFEIILECDSSELNNHERYYQDLFNVCGTNGLNCQLTTSSTKSGKHSKESIAKMKDRVLSESHKKLISLANKGKSKTPEHVAKIALHHKGKTISDSHKKRIIEFNTGKKHTNESKLKMSLAQKGKIVSDEARINQGIAQRNRMKSADERAKFGKPVVCLQTGIFYRTCKEASEAYNLNYSTLKSRLNGGQINNTSLIYA